MNKTFNYGIILISILIFFTVFAVFNFEITNGQDGSDFDSNLTNSIYKNNQNSFSFSDSSNYAMGIVRNSIFILADTNEPRSLTSTGVIEATNPENGLIKLEDYEGKAILVTFQQLDNEWIWGAEIIDVGGPLITELIKKIFNLQ